jgi:hypothetical protein
MSRMLSINFFFFFFFFFFSLSLYIDEIIKIWQNEDIKGIHLSRNENICTILFADKLSCPIQKIVYRQQFIN